MSTVEFMNLKTPFTKNINLKLLNQTVYILRNINLINTYSCCLTGMRLILFPSCKKYIVLTY